MSDFRFIHTYTEQAFPALAISGLWREGDGLKLMHKPASVPPFDFNTAAAVGSPLERLLAELRCPFYVDRLQGGVCYPLTYHFDPGLITHLRELLGDRFLGFQIHEWASNLHSDQQRILALCEKEGVDAADPAARGKLLELVRQGEKDLFLEAYPPRVWAERPLFTDLSGFLREAETLYRRRRAETGGLLFPADSYYPAPKWEIAHGATMLLPEIGWQIPNLRAQIAYTRGMASGGGLPWGVYYECWQNTEGYGFTIPYSLRAGQDEWLEDQLHTGNGAGLPMERRERGGSSLSLMARAWRYAYFSGASVIGEEYGVCNTFRDLTSAELSPYGEVKKAFLRFTERFPNVGVPFKPIAAVLPKELPMVDIRFPEQWFDFPAAAHPALRPEDTGRINEAVKRLFGAQGQHGNYGHVLKNGGWPDVIDLIHADTPSLESYGWLIDLTGDPAFAKTHRNLVPIEAAERLSRSLLPVLIDGDLHTAYNKTADGWLILCMNHDGVLHDGLKPDEFLPEAAVHAPIRFTEKPFAIRLLDGDGTLTENGSDWALTLRAGEWALLALS